jgi:Alpha-2,8-polysialyltransferase (POLYST)
MSEALSRHGAVFCASTMFHLVVQQALARTVNAAGGSSHLVLWGVVPRHQERMYGTSQAALEALLLPGCFETVFDARPVAAVQNLHAVWMAGGVAQPLLLAERLRLVQERLQAYLDGINGLDSVVVSNPTAGGVDRLLLEMATRRKLRRVFAEDGIGAYLPLALKYAIDRTYWQPPRPRPERSLRRLSYSLAALRLRYPRSLAEPRANFADLEFDEVWSFFPARVRYPVRRARTIAPSLVRDVLAGITERLGDSSERYDERTLVYASRADSEDGLLPLEEEVRYASEAVLRLAAELRLDSIVVKPHPRDQPEKIRLLRERVAPAQGMEGPASVPMELLAYRWPAATYCGTWSGCLLYGSLWAGVDSWSLMPYLLRNAATDWRLPAIWAAVHPVMAGRVRDWHG